MGLLSSAKGMFARAFIKVDYEGRAAEKGLKTLKKDTISLNGVMKGMGGTLAIFSGGLFGVVIAMRKVSAAINFTVDSVKKFDASSARLRAILKPTTKEFEALEKAALKLGKTTVFTASQSMDAFVELGKLGMKTNEILAASNAVLSLAALAQVEMAQSAIVVTQTLNQFQLQAEESNRVVDIMAKSFTTSALDMEKFSQAMTYVGPIAGTTGEALEDVSGALAVLANNAIDSSMAGTSLRRIMLLLSDENSKASRVINLLNKDAGTLTEKFQALKDAQLSATEVTDLFGLRSTAAAQVIIKNVSSVRDLAEEYRNADGAAKEMADTMLDSLEGSMIRLKSAQEGLALTLKDVLTPAYKGWNNILINIVLNLTAVAGLTKNSYTFAQKEIDQLTTKEEKLILIRKQMEIVRKITQATLQESQQATPFQKSLGIVPQNKSIKLQKEAKERLLELQREINSLLGIAEDKHKNSLTYLQAMNDAEYVTLENIKKIENRPEIDLKGKKKKSKKDLDPLGEDFGEGRFPFTSANEEIETLKNVGRVVDKEEQERIKKLGKQQSEEYRNILIKRGEMSMELERIRIGKDQTLYDQKLKMLEEYVQKTILTQEEANLIVTNMNEQRAEKEKQLKIDAANYMFNSASQLSNSIGSLSNVNTQIEIANIDRQINARKAAGKKYEDLEKQKDKLAQNSALRQKQFALVGHAAKVFEATGNIFTMATGAAANTPGGVMMRTGAYMTALAQGFSFIAAMKSLEIPRMQTGQEAHSRQPDNRLALINSAEAVISAPQTAIHRETVTAIQRGTANVEDTGKSGTTYVFHGIDTEQTLHIIKDSERRGSKGITL